MQPSWEASLRPRSPPPGVLRRHQQVEERQQQLWQQQQQQQRQRQQEMQQGQHLRAQQRQQQHQHHPQQQHDSLEEEEEPRQPLAPPLSLSPLPSSATRPPFSTTSFSRYPPSASPAYKAPISTSTIHHHAPPPPPSSSPPRSPTLPTPAAAFQRLSRLRTRTESTFHKMLTDLPSPQQQLAPPPALASLTPAFDLSTLKRQVKVLQEELASRYLHQEGLFRQNLKLWELLRAVCATPDWAAAEGEVQQVHAALAQRQAEVDALRHSLQELQAVKARLLAVRGEREKARVNLKVAQDGKAKATRALAAVLADNQALEEELGQQTAALQDLQQYLAKCQATQQEEDLEELGEVAARIHSSPSSASSLRRRRRAFCLLRLATYRSRRLREIGARFEAVGVRMLARKVLGKLAQHRVVAQHARRAQARKNAVLLQAVWGAWQRHTKQEQLFRLAARRRLLRRCLDGWRQAAVEGQRRKWVEAQGRKLEGKRILRAVLRGWHHVALHATATRQDGMSKAAAAWTRRAWSIFRRRLEQQRAMLQAQGEVLAAKVCRRRLGEGWRVWVLQWKVARFQARMLERHPRRVPTTLARCLDKWAAWARLRRVFARTAVAKGERQWQARAVGLAVRTLARYARFRRRARVAERVACKARSSRMTRRALLLRWLPRAEAWRARRVQVEKGILTRRRRGLRRGLKLWAGWTRGERKTRSRARPHRPGSRLHVLGLAVGRWKALVARKAREREGRREGEVVARRWQRRRKAQGFRRWRDVVLGRGNDKGGREAGEEGKGAGRERRVALGGLRRQMLLQQAFDCWVQAATTTNVKGKEGGKEARSTQDASSNSAMLLREIDALVAEVDAAERQLQAKVLGVARATATAAGAMQVPREEGNDGKEAAAAVAYHQQQLSALKAQERTLETKRGGGGGRVRGAKECLARLAPSSSGTTGMFPNNLKPETFLMGDAPVAARQFKFRGQSRQQAQEVSVTGRVQKVEGQVQQLLDTAEGTTQARTRILREKRAEKAALEARLSELRYAEGGGGRKGGRRGGGSQERREEEQDHNHDQEISQVLGLNDEDDDGNHDIGGAGRRKKEGGWRGRAGDRLQVSGASSPIKKRSKTLFAPSPVRESQSPLERQQPRLSPFRIRSIATAVGGLVVDEGEEGWKGAEGEEEDSMFGALTESIDALQARILDKLNNNSV